MKNFILFLFVLISISSFSQKKHEDGVFKDYYDNGKLKVEGYYRNNNKISIWKEYYNSGQLHWIYTFDNKGVETGNKESYFKNGILSRKTNKLKNGGLLVKDYYESGPLKILTNYIDGELNVIWEQFYETGEKEWEVNYFSGYMQGDYKQYYQNGNLKVEGTYLANLKNGEEKRYDESGNLTWKGVCLKNDFDDEWIQFDNAGNEIKTLKYKNGKLKGSNNDVVLEPTNVPDAAFERVPIYPGCENVLGFNAQKKCMSDNISEFVNRKFNTNIAKDVGLVGRQRINVIFKINREGEVADIRARATHPELEKEAISIIKSLPKMTPGMQRGKAVVVPYSLPIVFEAPSKPKTNDPFKEPLIKTRNF